MNIHEKQVAHLRVDYSLKTFDEHELIPDPIVQFSNWMQEAIQAEVNEPNAMTLATVKPDGSPAARIVLLKGIDQRGFSFFTNYNSHKGMELELNKKVALVFCWLELQRQVRIEGIVQKLSPEESFDYFKTRPRNSQIGAHASPQSKPLQSRDQLETLFQQTEERFNNQEIPLPNQWGGYLVVPQLIEFWQGRQSRLHDRFMFQLTENQWKINRLAP